ncbi:MAG: hypothetical protein HKN26_02760 [Acidimicrobiales bacterium]|nr:hypothetical protein [Acidimicrobiales bacterium]
MELFDTSIADRQPAAESADVGVDSPSTGAVAALVVSHLDSFPRARSMVELGVLRGHLDAYEAGVLASAIDDGATERDIDGLSRRRGGSKRTVRKKTKRAKAVRKNPKLGDKLRDGSLTDEKLDAIADASDKSDGAAAEDERLIADIEDAPVDQAGDIVRKWLNNHEDPDKTETKHQKQRRLRGMKRFETKDGLEALLATGDKSSIDQIWNLLTQDADAAYRSAGGRDVPGSKHRTTHLQRLYDAFVGRITGEVETEDGDTKPAARADTGRPTVFASLSLDPDTGEMSRAELAGGGPLPSCHHHVHDNNLTLERAGPGWPTRPATPREPPTSVPIAGRTSSA